MTAGVETAEKKTVAQLREIAPDHLDLIGQGLGIGGIDIDRPEDDDIAQIVVSVMPSLPKEFRDILKSAFTEVTVRVDDSWLPERIIEENEKRWASIRAQGKFPTIKK